MGRMSNMSSSTALFLLATLISAGGLGCHARPVSQTASSAMAPAVSSTALKEVHVDQRCHVLQDQIHGVTGLSLRTDDAICHLESVHTSQHVEESVANGTKRRLVTVSEQEYMLQNVTAEPVVFVVEQAVAKDWHIDSDPPPAEMMGLTALFRVEAQPGQIVRLGWWRVRRVRGGDGKDKSKMRGSLRCARDGEAVHRFGRDDEVVGGDLNGNHNSNFKSKSGSM
jgi:hypothetical protein